MKVIKTEVLSRNNEYPLALYIGLPEGNPRGIIEFVPGVYETNELFLSSFEAFTKEEFICVTYDHRGTGRSVHFPEEIGHLGRDANEELAEDIYTVAEQTSRMYAGLSVFVVTHDYASLMALSMLKNHDNQIKALAFVNPIAQFPGMKLGKLITEYSSIVVPTHFKSKFANRLFYKKVERKKREDFPFLYTGKSLTDLYLLAFNQNSTKGYYLKKPNLPIFIGVGEKDIMKNYGVKLKDTLYKIGYKNVDMRYYREGTHNLFEDVEKEQLLHDLLLFFTLSL